MDVRYTLRKGGGPYYGPRGGVYADPEHKRPWKGSHADELGRLKDEASAAMADPSLSSDQVRAKLSELRTKRLALEGASKRAAKKKAAAEVKGPKGEVAALSKEVDKVMGSDLSPAEKSKQLKAIKKKIDALSSKRKAADPKVSSDTGKPGKLTPDLEFTLNMIRDREKSHGGYSAKSNKAKEGGRLHKLLTMGLIHNVDGRWRIKKAHSAGPYFGPRGGKYADPELKTPWRQEDWVGDPGDAEKAERRAVIKEAVAEWVSANDAWRTAATAKDAGPRNPKTREAYQAMYDALDAVGRAANLDVQKFGGEYARAAASWLRKRGHAASVADRRIRRSEKVEQMPLFKAIQAELWKGHVLIPHSDEQYPIQVDPPQVTRDEFPFCGFIDFQGVCIDVENRAGSVRMSKDGKWTTTMLHHYGEVRDTEGADGDPLDVYVCADPLEADADSPLVVVVHQQFPDTGEYDEDKVMLGWRSKAAAIEAYKAQYDSVGFYGGCTVLSIGRLKRWISEQHRHGRMVKSHLSVEMMKSRGMDVGAVTTRKDGTKWRKEASGWVQVTDGKAPAKHDDAGDAAGGGRDITIKPHEKLGMYDIDLHVKRVSPDQVILLPSADAGSGPVVNVDVLRQVLGDLQGKVKAPPHPSDDRISAVGSGEAEFLGKGDDGLAFRAGDSVVKVSTVVPYNPFNNAYRTADEAVDMLRSQAEMGNQLADAGVPTLRSEFVEHDGRGYQVKPYVEIPEKLSQEQLDEAQEAIHKLHDAGYSLNDTVQVGIHEGRVVLYDIGKAAPHRGTGPMGTEQADLDHLKGLYSDHGGTFKNTRESELDQLDDMVMDTMGKENIAAADVEELAAKFRSAEAAEQKRIASSLTGPAARRALDTLREKSERMSADIEMLWGFVE